MKSGAQTKRYRSPLREEQAELTRRKILDAIVAELSAGGFQDFSIAAVAERAGVSERTVYRHFPDREAILQGLDEAFSDLLSLDRLPTSLSEVVEVTHRLFPMFDREEKLMRARLNTELGQETRLRQRRARHARFRQMVGAEIPRLTEGQRKLVAAIIGALVNSQTWRQMKDESDLSSEEAAHAISWVLGLMVDALEGGDAPHPDASGGES